MARTRFPKSPRTFNGREMTEEEIAKYESMYKPPMTAKERIEKQMNDQQVPDNSTSDGLY